MTRKLQILRGTTAQNNAYTGAVGELTMDTDRNEVRIHDGQTVGGIKISDRNMPILMPMWSDHLLNDVSWLRADTFSWQSGDVYKAAYVHLVGDLDTVQKLYCWLGEKMGDEYYTYSESPSVGETTTDGDAITSIDSYGRPVVGAEYLNRNPDGDILSTQTDTIGDITITYYLAQDGHKICMPDQESNIVALYEATGVAWYYILDIENKQFKLPRTKWGFTGLRDGVGNYVEAGLPDHTHTITMNRTNKSGTDTGTVWSYNENKNGTGTVQSEGASNSIYGASDTVQPPATQMYLYFYVGNFEQSAVEQTAGINAEMFNGKADRNLLNTTDNVDIVIESQLPTASNGYTWYRKYKSGWVEQGGVKSVSGDTFNAQITLPITMQDDNYHISVNATSSSSYTSNTNSCSTNRAALWSGSTNRKSTTLFYINMISSAFPITWRVSGYAA